ncbi:MAG: mevalonate kinase [Candidatus Thorarchaeota archaeon]|nr:MAG: mevalonate kinase [Candidatus Thorarchaeota archaeon]
MTISLDLKNVERETSKAWKNIDRPKPKAVCEIMGVGSGKGKSILFGEHFVVYGIPSIAAGISSETVAKVTRTEQPGWTLDDRRPAVSGYKEKKLEEQKGSIENILSFCGVDISKRGIHIELEGDLVCASGIGASAASCVALARSLNEEFSLGFDDSKINEAAYQGELGYHGTPSGIDNTASTYGGLIWYVRDLEGGSPTFEMLKLSDEAHLVIASTGITASTKDVVGDVRKKKEEDPSWFDSIADKYTRLVYRARDAFFQFDLREVGLLMNENHQMLRELTVSCEELDNLVEIARRSGALGAKMTGTGRGGNQLSLAADLRTAEKIAEALAEEASGVWITTFGR